MSYQYADSKRIEITLFLTEILISQMSNNVKRNYCSSTGVNVNNSFKFNN